MAIRGIAFAVSCIALGGCATVEHIPLAVVSMPPLAPQIDKSVLLVLDTELKGATGTSSTSLAKFQTQFVYPLGEVLPNIVERSLSEQFKEVVSAADDSRRSSFDIVVTPRLRSFAAVVPATVFTPTKTTVELEYLVYDAATDTTRTLSATGAEVWDVPGDEQLLKRLEDRIPQEWRENNVGKWWALPAPVYNSDAGRDAMMAILHAVDDLNRQLIAHRADLRGNNP